MPYKLKFVGSDKFPSYFKIPTYYEIVEVKDGIAIVDKEVTMQRLLKEGFILVEDKEYENKEAMIDPENPPKVGNKDIKKETRRGRKARKNK